MSEGLAGLYLHVPFCHRVCPYCDFAVRTGDAARRRRYVDHLLAEIRLYADYPRRFDTIYFGGGTPSSLAMEDLHRILDSLASHLSFATDRRVFLEANPEDADAEALEGWRRLGIETLSLGIQSFNEDSLRFLGRRHTPDQARGSIGRAKEAGFGTVAIDLIYGLPGQQATDWQRDLEQAVALGVDHLSCYQLTIHERTRFGLLAKRGTLTQLTEDRQAELFHRTHRWLEDNGLPGYEVSQFASGVEHRSRHNLKYWDHTPYLGLGPSAHSFDTDRRWWNIRRTDPYQDRVAEGRRPIEDEENLDDRALVLETLMTGLRTHAGVDLESIRQRRGIDLLKTNARLIDLLRASRLAHLGETRLVPTLDGLAVADSIARRFELG